MGRGRKGGGRGRGGGRGGGGGGDDDGSGRFSDQYGETMVGQDKGDHFGFGGRGGGGGGGGSKGGDAGSRSKPGQDLAYIRHVPKFLQAHAHMLGTAVEEEPEAAALRQKYDSGGEEEGAGDDEADEQQEALRRAIEQDPSLLAQHPELHKVAQAAEAEAVKARGNTAFAAGKFEEAVALFTRCIELDGGNHIYYSNRAAAHTGLKDYRAAARDAARCTQLRPQWAKGWSRLGAAHFGLEEFSEAREAYEQACKLEPNDSQLQLALQRAAAREGKQVAEGKHTFKRKLDAGGGSGGGGGGQQEKRPQTVRPSAAKKEKTLLSFGGDEEEEEEV